MKTLYFDGSCGPNNPGPWASYGWAIVEDDLEILYGYGTLAEGHNTNNIAEYVALIKGLQAILRLGQTDNLVVKGDSTLVIKQVGLEWNCNSPHLRELLSETLELTSKFGHIEWQWIPRDKNTRCDSLAETALKQMKLKKIPPAYSFKHKNARYLILFQALEYEEEVFRYSVNTLAEAFNYSRLLVNYARKVFKINDMHYLELKVLSYNGEYVTWTPKTVQKSFKEMLHHDEYRTEISKEKETNQILEEQRLGTK